MQEVTLKYLESDHDPEFASFRRPGIICGKHGRLVCYYEGHARNKRRQTLFARVSDDCGSTWSDRIPLATGGDTGMLHNIMMAYAKGRYYCIWNVQYRQLWLTESADGEHWDPPRDLTRQLWRADCSYPWNAFGTGSGHCTVLDSGRILIPTWFTTGGDGHKPSAFGCIYTDDLFQTVRIGGMIEDGPLVKNPNEGALAQASDGSVIATVRHDNDARMRVFARSNDGASSWDDIVFRPDLPDPICHAALCSDKNAGMMLFCNCANADAGWREKHSEGLSRYLWSDDARKDLTLRVSLDDGRHFSRGVHIADKGGYSDLALSESSVACIFETDWDLEETCVSPHALGLACLPLSILREAD